MLEVHQFPCLQDNYGFILRDSVSGRVATVDTPDASEITRQLETRGWPLDVIMNTHHHPDHAGGNLALKKRYGCQIVGPRGEAATIPGIDLLLDDGDVFTLGGSRATVQETPGHTLGHIVYHFADEGIAFVGDTLFAMGCGRLFEGTAAQMWSSMQKLLAWPNETMLYCAHEYTQANARFALSVEPNNKALIQRAAQVDALRERGLPTVPMQLVTERATNPFLRPDSKELQAELEMLGEELVSVFAETRRRKDVF